MSTQDRIKREEQLTQKFLDAMKAKAEEIEMKPNSILTPAERNRMLALNKVGYWQGALAGIGAFAILRKGPIAMTKFLQKYFFKKSGPSTPFDSAIGGNRPLEELLGKESRLMYYGWLTIDTVLSIAAAGAVAALNVDREEFMEEMSQLPLVEGRSLFSDEFCPVAIEAYAKLEQEDPEATWTPQTAPLQTARKFMMNCRRRHAYEQKLRFSQALGENEPVEIPPPGVPLTTEVDLGAPSFESKDSFNSESSQIDWNGRA